MSFKLNIGQKSVQILKRNFGQPQATSDFQKLFVNKFASDLSSFQENSFFKGFMINAYENFPTLRKIGLIVWAQFQQKAQQILLYSLQHPDVITESY